MRIFLSYTKRGSDRLGFERVLADLRKADYDVWFDERLRGGQQWWDEILKQIRRADALVSVVTQKSMQSEACNKELRYAQDLGKPLIGVKVEKLSDLGLPQPLVSRQVIDYCGRLEDTSALEPLLKLTRALDPYDTAVARQLPEPLPAEPEAPVLPLTPFAPLFDSAELAASFQDELLSKLRTLCEDVDNDRVETLELVRRWTQRPDVTYRARQELERLATSLDECADVYSQLPRSGQSVGAPTASTRTTKAEDRHARPHGGPASTEGRPPSTDTESAVERGPAAADEHPPAQQGPWSERAVRISAPGATVADGAFALLDWLKDRGYEVRCDHVADEAARDQFQYFMLQCRSKSLRRMTGAGAALTILLGTDGDDLVVDFLNVEWADKLAVGTVAVLLAWPAVVPAVMGIRRQVTLRRDSIAFLREWVESQETQEASE